MARLPWLRLLPWRFVLRRWARSQGFLDPVGLLARLQRFSQPSEVAAPTELLRAGALMQARGLLNSQAIQHNLDWLWPYWVERQFDPRDTAFIPRSFNLTHINLSHRNWTALAQPDFDELPIVDPRGLVTPRYDGWSLDAWYYPASGLPILPSRESSCEQTLLTAGGLAVRTRLARKDAELVTESEVVRILGRPALRLKAKAVSPDGGWLVVSLRPSNPEGVSLVETLEFLKDRRGLRVNGLDTVLFSSEPERTGLSMYAEGDVYRLAPRLEEVPRAKVSCGVGLCTAAMAWRVLPGEEREVTVKVPLRPDRLKACAHFSARSGWADSLVGSTRLRLPDKRWQYLYDVALRTLVVHSPSEVYPGPFTYKRFWFRDAAFIIHALLCAGMTARAWRAVGHFHERQTPFGYFLSQEGEWDSNGQALWTLGRAARLAGRPPDPAWLPMIRKGVRWIVRKRLPDGPEPHSGLLPAGFSAEHLGPNDYYYWDDLWAAGGLREAAWMLRALGDVQSAEEAASAAEAFTAAVDRSLSRAQALRPDPSVLPASPYRRPDAGSIGSLAGGYPLRLWEAKDARLLATADHLVGRYFLQGGFYQEISHSGINAYLSLHVAQIYLAAGRRREFTDIVRAIADLASPTGQWPEAVHPRTRGGCMGDGQHVWAAAEWILALRNMIVREEDGALVAGSGVPAEWLDGGGTEPVEILDAPTEQGPVSLRMTPQPDGTVRVEWKAAPRDAAAWRLRWDLPGREPLEVQMPSGQATLTRSGVRRDGA
ncbi:MAG: hypothetical protein MOGMAGMI_00134 [Candidatus Omnitrophica bacterium]|nr:hypothetical protein [Candidatus Omnitrophota bacterium]